MTPPPSQTSSQPSLFAPRKPEPTSFPLLPVVLAGLVLLIVVAVLLLRGHNRATSDPNALQPLDPHAATLPISGIEMSESESLSGGKSTFIDGHIHNTGTAPLIAATVQVLFANDSGQSPQIVTMPLTLIRTHQPYIDIEPISADPVLPGQDREFRLIFESVDPSWNQSVPEIHIVHTNLR